VLEDSKDNVNFNNEINDEQKVDLIDNDPSILLSHPWYFQKNGERYPKPARINKKTGKRLAKLTPSEDVRSDRITNQLMFVPPNYEDIKNEGRLKTILLYNGLGPWNVKQGRDVFASRSKCPVDTCTITQNRDKAKDADLILFKDHYIPTGVAKHPKQLYMLYLLECPFHTQHIKFPDVFNWTATYR
jgi:glycoprotein 3-alpha-L-fucosyltransferase